MAIGSGTSARNLGIWSWTQAQDAKKEGESLLGREKTSALLSLGRGRDAGLTSIGKGYDQARNDLTTQYAGAIDRLDPWTSAGKTALTTLQGSLGLGGDAARDAAVSTYRASPGYERRVAEATDAVARKASATGALGSGNTMQAISDRANYLADEDYGRWQGQIQGLSDRGQQAATTQAGMQTNLGNNLATLGQSRGRDEAAIHTDTAGREAGIYGQFAGLGLNNLWNGTNLGVNAVNQAGQRADDNVKSGYSFGANLLGSGLNLLNLGMGGGLGGNLLRGVRNIGTSGLNYY